MAASGRRRNAARILLELHSLPEMPAAHSAMVRWGNTPAPGRRRHARSHVPLL